MYPFVLEFGWPGAEQNWRSTFGTGGIILPCRVAHVWRTWS